MFVYTSAVCWENLSILLKLFQHAVMITSLLFQYCHHTAETFLPYCCIALAKNGMRFSAYCRLYAEIHDLIHAVTVISSHWSNNIAILMFEPVSILLRIFRHNVDLYMESMARKSFCAFETIRT
jgi:hypothetical protein